MREIKFRAWDKDNQYMNKWDQVKQWSFNSYEQSSIVLMQYTGLKDKNGTPIYEGDVVEIYLYEYAGVDETQTITVGDSRDNTNFYTDVGYLQNINQKHIEVIGNKFEDKDLLE